MKNLFFLFLTLFFVGCSNKQITIKSLQPSNIDDKKIHNVILEEFENDYINQANHLEEVLVNKTIDGERIFNLMPTYENIDAIITGEVLESSLNYNFYYDDDEERCIRYDSKTKECEKYKIIRIPCEKKNFRVKTQIQVLDKYENLLFSKIYTKKKFSDECFKNKNYYSPYFYNHHKKQKEKYQVNSQLSFEIAKEAINDISPHYRYFNINIIEKLDDEKSVYSKEFETIVELLDNGNIQVAQDRLKKLDSTLQGSSYEVLYNLALTYEAKGNLPITKIYYEDAAEICENLDNLKLIDNAILRVNRNIINKQKASFQLD